MTKAKLYELLASLIQLDEPEICEKLIQSKILNYILIDFDKFEDNTNLLLLLSSVVKSLVQTKANSPEIPMCNKILFDLKLLETFKKKL